MATRKKSADAPVMKPMPKVMADMTNTAATIYERIAEKPRDYHHIDLPSEWRAKQPAADVPTLGPVNEGIEQGAVKVQPVPVVQLPVERPAPLPAPVPPTPVDIPGLMAAALDAHQKGDLASAEQLYQGVLAMNWAEPEVLRRVGEVCLAQGRHKDALPNLLKAIALHAHDPRTNAQAGVCCSFLGDFEQAGHYYRRAIAISPNFPLARWNNSLLLLLNGDYAEGWDEYRWGTLLGVRPNRHVEAQWDAKYRDAAIGYRATEYGHKTLYIWAEQGFGDGLMFLRFTKGLKRDYGFKRIVLEMQPPLLPLLWDYDREDIDLVVGAQADGGFIENFDEHISLAELPRVLGVRVDTIPSASYLTAPPSPQAEAVLSGWRATRKAEGKFLVGICWKGNPGHVNDKARSVDVSRFAALASACPHVQFVPLVPGEKPAFCPDAFDLANFEATAQVMKHLDLVISVDTSVVHLAGALGVPCWNLIAKSCDWRWHRVPGDAGKSVWYDSVRLYRQQVQGEWQEVFDRVQSALLQRTDRTPAQGLGSLPEDGSADGGAVVPFPFQSEVMP